jgi:hypothetical protein
MHKDWPTGWITGTEAASIRPFQGQKMPNELPLSDKDSAVLRTVAAAAKPPGTIVADFDKLLDLLEKDGIQVSPKTREFGIASLPALNAQLSEPAAIGLARGRQTSYPHLDGLHMLLRQTRLGRLDASKSVPRMVLDHEMRERWAALNPTERYFALLNAWWNPADANTEWAATQMADYRLNLLELHQPGGATKAKYPSQIDGLFHLVGMKHVGLAQMFGMVVIKQETAAPGAGWKIARMTATPWGLTSCQTFMKACKQTSRWLFDQLLNQAPDENAAEAASAFDYWSATVKPCFPNWERLLDTQQTQEAFHGSITFKVSLGETWRRIVMSGENDFDELAMFILDAFNFDDEHLYQFDYQDEYGERRSLEDPRCQDLYDQYADAVLLGEIGLQPKQIIDFRYDFGDDWRFKVQVEALDPTQRIKTPKVIAKAGKAPKQY